MAPLVDESTLEEQEKEDAPPLTLAEHRAQFGTGNGPEAPEPTNDEVVEKVLASTDPPQQKPRHRAKSQQAGADDVKAIAEHTKRLRDAEAAIGIQRKEGESERVYQIRLRAEIAELAKSNGAKAAAPAAPVIERQAAVPTPPPQTTTAGATFTEQPPTMAQFKDSDDPYRDYVRALASYDRRKDTFEEKQADLKTRGESEQKTAQDAHQKWVNERNAEHGARLDTFLAKHPDAKKRMEDEAKKPEGEQISLTPIMYAAMHLHDQGPAFMDKLLQDRNFADELFLLTDGKPLGNPLANPLVATVQRRLLARGQAVSTGSAASARPIQNAPRPPNPVRTVPQSQPETAEADSENMSLREHRKQFPIHGRR